MVEELKEKFNKLSDKEKMAFLKAVMPSFCQDFGRSPGKTMEGMIPFCRDMMKSWPADMEGMLRMMGTMNNHRNGT